MAEAIFTESLSKSDRKTHRMSQSTINPSNIVPSGAPSAPLAPSKSAVLPDEDVGVELLESLKTYDAIGLYLSFVLHLLALMLLLGVLKILGWYYFDTYKPVDPIRAALSDETVLDDEPFLQPVMELQSASSAETEFPEDAALAVTGKPDKDALEAVSILDRMAGSESNVGRDGSEMWIPRGSNAVTKGSFTGWTMPEQPPQGVPYAIVLEVKLPDGSPQYKLTDLSGKVIGSDGYDQFLPWDKRDHRRTWPYRRKDNRLFKVKRSDRIKVENNKVQVVIKVPGAEEKVRDVITIRSERLKEEQTLTLTFGARVNEAQGPLKLGQ